MCCGFSKRARKAWQLRSPLRGLLSASVSISVGLAHTEESNFRNGNEKSSSGVIWLQCGLTMQCVGKEEGPFPEHFLNKGTCHHGQECWGGYTGSEEIELVTSIQHTPQVQHCISEKLPHPCACADYPCPGQKWEGSFWHLDFPHGLLLSLLWRYLFCCSFSFSYFLTLFFKSFLSYRAINIWLF